MRVAELPGCRLFDRERVEAGAVHDVQGFPPGP